MDFKKLKYIITVAEVQSISKAAAILYISQPSLSHVISNLETELGSQIFNRTTTPISLTYAGERFVKTARDILNMDSKLKKEFSDISSMRKGRIIIGIPAFRGSFMLPLILPIFHKEFPGIELSLFEGSGQELEHSLLNGKVDIVLTGGPIKEERFVQEIIYKEKIKIACKKGYLSREYLIDGTENVIDFSKLNNFDFILTKKGRIIRTYADEIFHKYGITPNIILETSNSGTAYRLAIAGMGLSFAAEMTINSVSATEEYDLYDICSPGFGWEIVALHRKGDYITAAERRLIDLAKEVFSKKLCY